MAIQNKWIDADVEAGKRGAASKVSGGRTVAIAFTFEVAAADSDTSIYKIAKLPANAIPLRAELYADASLGTSAFQLGLYKEDGTVADVDLFLASTDLTAGVAITAGANNGLTNLGGADPVAAVGQKIWELLGLTVDTKKEAYILAITAPTTGAAAGTISGTFSYIVGA